MEAQPPKNTCTEEPSRDPVSPPTPALSATTAKTAEELSLCKLRAEARKAELKAEELGSPWYRRPQMLAIMVPAIVAVIALLGGIFSGAIEAKLTLIEIKQADLDKKQAQYEKSLADYERQRHDLDLKLKSIEAEARTAPIRFCLQAMKQPSGAFASTVRPLLTAIRANSSNEAENLALVKAAADAEPEPRVRAWLLEVLYVATNKAEYREALWRLVRAQDGSFYNEFYTEIFGYEGVWEERHMVEVLDLLVELVGKPGQSTVARADLFSALAFRYNRIPIGPVRSRTRWIGLLAIARDQSISDSNDANVRLGPLKFLREVSPNLASAVASVIIVHQHASSELLDGIDRVFRGTVPKVPLSTELTDWKEWEVAHSDWVRDARDPQMNAWIGDSTKTKWMFSGQ